MATDGQTTYVSLPETDAAGAHVVDGSGGGGGNGNKMLPKVIAAAAVVTVVVIVAIVLGLTLGGGGSLECADDEFSEVYYVDKDGQQVGTYLDLLVSILDGNMSLFVILGLPKVQVRGV